MRQEFIEVWKYHSAGAFECMGQVLGWFTLLITVLLIFVITLIAFLYGIFKIFEITILPMLIKLGSNKKTFLR